MSAPKGALCQTTHVEPPTAGQESVATAAPFGAQTLAAFWAVTTLNVKDGVQSK